MVEILRVVYSEDMLKKVSVFGVSAESVKACVYSKILIVNF